MKALGISEFSVDDLKKVHAIAPISAVELEWSLFAREAEVRLSLQNILGNAFCNLLEV